MTEPAKYGSLVIRDRDELWCRCLCATLDPREIEKVLVLFNSTRPDKPKEGE